MSKPDDKHPSRTEGAESSGKDLGPVDYLKAARAQLRIGNNDQAYRILLQAAVDYPDNALILSYYGCLQALVDGRYQSGIAACKKAIAVFQAPDKYSVGVIYPILYLNLGRACLAAGRKKDAVEAFTKGGLEGKALEAATEGCPVNQDWRPISEYYLGLQLRQRSSSSASTAAAR